MIDQKPESYRDLWMLGMVITVPMILVSGPLAGYWISHYVLVRYLGLPSLLVPLCIGLGAVGSGLQIFRILQKIRQSDLEKNQKKKPHGER